MITRRLALGHCLSVLGLPAVLLVGSGVFAREGARLAVVVAKGSSVSELSMHDLRRLYTGEPGTTPDGKPQIPIALAAGSPDRVGFDQVVTGMPPDILARFWIDRRIRGESGSPKAVSSPELMLRLVAALAGSIGYVRATDVRGDVKLVRIDGKLPTDDGYPIVY